MKRNPLRLISYTLNLNPAIREVIAKIFAQWAVSLSEVEQTGSLRQWLAEQGLARFYAPFVTAGYVSSPSRVCRLMRRGCRAR